MSAADIPYVPASILKKKSRITHSIDTTKHTIETNVDANGTATKSIVKRKIPSSKALVPVPILPENRFTHTGNVYQHEDNFADEGGRRYSDKMYDKYWRDHPEELAKMNRENYEAGAVAKYEFNHHPDEFQLDRETHSNLKNRKKQKMGTGTWFPDGTHIQDAKYTEIVEKAVHESSQFRKAPAKDARNLGLAKRSTEPAGIAAISENKRQLKNQL